MTILWAIVFLLALTVAWLTNVIGLPGNWLMLLFSVFYGLWMPPDAQVSISMTVLLVLAALAAVGELAELALSSASVSKAGGNRRSALYAIVGSIVGGVAGMVMGIPIPLIGPIVASLLFGSLGAMAGAMYGEWSTGTACNASLQIGKAAFWGRALGTLAKLVVGLIMLCVAVIGVIF